MILPATKQVPAQVVAHWKGRIVSARVQGQAITLRAELLTLSGRMPELEAALDATGTASIEIAPGCELRRHTCAAKFGNLLNFGGFPDIPGRNPYGGGSIL